MPRKPLGRGLSALLGDDEKKVSTGSSASHETDIDLIEPNPEQPRTRFVDEALDELARSIAVNGIVQPIVVRKKADRYQIIAGERRWRAAQRAGLRKVPIVLREVSDEKLLEVALVENIQRQELNPVEEARAYRKLIDSIGLTQEEVSERVGKERSLIATSLRLLKLPVDILTLIEDGRLSAGHGRALLMADDPAAQKRIARLTIEKGLSVRECERAVKGTAATGKTTTKTAAASNEDPNIRAAETKLMRALSTNVRIRPKAAGKGGKIEIEYYTADDLNRIYDVIISKREG